jgi:hypothetical protein
MKTVLVTSLYGDYDILRRVPIKRAHFDGQYCVTDQLTTTTNWTLITESDGGMHPRLAAKRAKCMPWNYVDADVSIWVDASARILLGNYLKNYCLDLLKTNDIVVWKHWSDRTDIREEAEFCYQWPKYSSQPLLNQVDYYKNLGLPTPSGLWECGLVAMNHHNPKVRGFGFEWFNNQKNWSMQDQLSFPYLVWKHDLKVGADMTRPEAWDIIQYHDHNRKSYEDE